MSSRFSKLAKKAFVGQITATAFVTPRILLASTGPFLKVFDVLSGKTVAVFEIFQHVRVHGIHPEAISDDPTLRSVRVALSGGKEGKVVNLSFQYHNKTGALETCDHTVESSFPVFVDWVKDVYWIPPAEPATRSARLALAFAHNFVQVWSLETFQLLDQVQCEEHCILYSARFFKGADGVTYLASGTVFNQILLWDMSKRNEKTEGVVGKRLIGHEGVIFNIRVSADGRRLATASDDRTIRVWETEVDRTSSHVALHGHSARIWDCKLIANMVVSIAEDSSCRVWNIDTEECIACWEGHGGKNVWAVDTDPLGNFVATGGGDSGIRLWNLASLALNKIDSDQHLTPVPLSEEPDSTETVKTFGLLSFSESVISTSTGRFLASDRKLELREIFVDEAFERYAVLTTSECGRLVVAGNIAGELVAFSPHAAFQPTKWLAHSGKVIQVFIRSTNQADVWHLFSGDEKVEELLMSTVTLCPEAGPCLIDRIATIILPVHFWTMDIAFSREHRLLIVGSRSGAVAIFETPLFDPAEGLVTEPACLEAKLITRRVHGKDSVSSIALDLRSSVKLDHELVFGTVGRDGKYCRFSVKRKDGIWVMEQLYRSKITKGWLEHLRFQDDMTIICGFYDKRFFAYNETKKYEMFSVACGGGRRRWDFRMEDALLNRATFGFLRGEQLRLLFRETDAVKRFSEPKLQDNHTGHETRVVRFLHLGDQESVTSLLVTSGEDAVLRFAEFDPRRKDQNFRSILSIKKHTSVVRGIAFTRNQANATLMFTAGAREELRCWRLEADGLSDVRCLDMAVAPSVSPVAESRVMDIGACSLDSFGTQFKGLHAVLAACSDAYLRLWVYDEPQCTFRLVGQSKAHGRCVLKARVFLLTDGLSVPVVAAVSAGTDGRIMTWDLGSALAAHDRAIPPPGAESVTELRSPVHVSKVHQSGINALDVAFGSALIEDGRRAILIATGGDDNAISATRISFRKQDEAAADAGLQVANITQGAALSPHSSGVTGIRVLPNGSLMTTSVDQRLNVVELAETEAGIYSFACVASHYVDVADISDMDTIASE
ncbi:WD repeat-containing protein 6 [Thoreauomyces humboldtii]|nr:WD repeat-containing protein 6 [Thoreauomyces humboldtii]